MIIHPYTNSKNYQSTGATWSANSTNFPACKLFFPCNEAAATNTLTDTQQGASLACATLTKPDAFSITSATTTGQTSTGTNFNLDTPFLLFAVAKGAFPNIRLGISTAGYASLITATPTVDNGGAETCRGTAFTLNTAGTIYGRANVITAFNSATGQTTYEFTTTSTASALANTPTDATNFATSALTTDGVFTFGASGWQQGTGTAIYGMAFFKFSAIPSNLKSALAWMTYQWSIGNKWIYPGWKGVS